MRSGASAEMAPTPEAATLGSGGSQKSPLATVPPRRPPRTLPSGNSSRGSRSSGLEPPVLSAPTSRPGSGSVYSSPQQPERQVLSPGPFRRQAGTLRHGEADGGDCSWDASPLPTLLLGAQSSLGTEVDGEAPGDRAPWDRTLGLPLLLGIALGPPPKCTTLTKARPNSADAEGAILPRAAVPGTGPSH